MAKIARNSMEQGGLSAGHGCTIEKFTKMNPPAFSRGTDPIVAKNWMQEIEKVLAVLQCIKELRVLFSTYKLTEEAKRWWMDFVKLVNRAAVAEAGERMDVKEQKQKKRSTPSGFQPARGGYQASRGGQKRNTALARIYTLRPGGAKTANDVVTVSDIDTFVEDFCNEPKITTKLFDMLFEVYADIKLLEEVSGVFERMVRKGIEIDERSCVVYLLALKKSGEGKPLLGILHRMVDAGKDRSKERRALDFKEVDEILRLMEEDAVDYKMSTYTILIKGYSSNGKIEEVGTLFEGVHEKGIEPNLLVYTVVTSLNCRLGKMMKAYALFDELIERDLVLNAHAYGALINGLCKARKMEAAKIFVDEMQSKGIDVNHIIFTILMDGYCKRGTIDETQGL
ncbi:pentatricopeptide repeat-containing protein At2g32630-like [Malania oleifera]|uniref:pentatricopeptide repeat-containing protein At2g32630-like n=1 Tax=Malania oleifera TaxID=397392 RepID=UPI0025AECD16|nr:pentatricopeptide repeat-containing protein At2g32630-like [Malania oleifera]